MGHIQNARIPGQGPPYLLLTGKGKKMDTYEVPCSQVTLGDMQSQQPELCCPHLESLHTPGLLPKPTVLPVGSSKNHGNLSMSLH